MVPTVQPTGPPVTTAQTTTAMPTRTPPPGITWTIAPMIPMTTAMRTSASPSIPMRSAPECRDGDVQGGERGDGAEERAARLLAAVGDDHEHGDRGRDDELEADLHVVVVVVEHGLADPDHEDAADQRGEGAVEHAGGESGRAEVGHDAAEDDRPPDEVEEEEEVVDGGHGASLGEPPRSPRTVPPCIRRGA